jgi:hypothetical protein
MCVPPSDFAETFVALHFLPSSTNKSAVKSKLINKAIQDIGMGRYNWQLFFLCGFGWFADK